MYIYESFKSVVVNNCSFKMETLFRHINFRGYTMKKIEQVKKVTSQI